MINLLPQELKTSITFARRNSVLMRWLAIVVVSIFGLYAILGIGYFYLHKTAADLSGQLNSQAGAFSEKEIKEVESEVKSLESGVELASNVLNRQLLFSKLLISIGNIIPDGARLSGLEINDTDKAIDLRFKVRSNVLGAQLAANLGDPDNNIFSKVDVQSVDCNTTDTSEYPCTANIRALFADNSSFRFTIDPSETKNE